jgi:alpha-1,2-mannosyltransferase
MWTILRDGSWLTRERLQIYPLMLAIISGATLVFLWATGPTGLTDRMGRPIGTDFASFWTAGRLLLAGDTTGMYHLDTHFAFQRGVFQDPDVMVFGWFYPPFFLGIAALLALLPYVPAFLVWQATTCALYLATIRAIAPRDPRVMLIAFAFPATFITFGHGQNAFLTASLLGCGLLLLDRAPLLAGVALGLLAYKPQLAVVLPVVLVLGGYWRTIAAATLTVVTMSTVVTAALGTEVWSAFFASMAITRDIGLEQGSEGWFKIQSVFSAVRFHGGSIHAAYLIQAIVSGAVLVTLAAMVLGKVHRFQIAAATCMATLLTTPFAHDYDMMIAGVAIAFSVASVAETNRGFAPYQISLLALVWLTPFIARSAMQATGIPLGVLVSALYFATIAHQSLNTVRFDILKRPRKLQGRS